MQVQQLAAALGALDASKEGAAQAIARYMFEQLRGYGGSASAEDVEQDVVCVADMLEAYAYLLQSSGVVVDRKSECIYRGHADCVAEEEDRHTAEYIAEIDRAWARR